MSDVKLPERDDLAYLGNMCNARAHELLDHCDSTDPRESQEAWNEIQAICVLMGIVNGLKLKGCNFFFSAEGSRVPAIDEWATRVDVLNAEIVNLRTELDAALAKIAAANTDKRKRRRIAR